MTRRGRRRGDAVAQPPSGEFWRRRPVDTDDPDDLARFAAAAADRRDGPALLAAGWMLGLSGAPGGERWLAHLRDGFAAWRAASDYDPRLGRRFLEQLLAELADEPMATDAAGLPTGPGAPDDVLAVRSTAGCWAASELLAIGVAPVTQMRLYRLIAAAPLDVVPPLASEWAYDYAGRHDLPVPWDRRTAPVPDQLPE